MSQIQLIPDERLPEPRIEAVALCDLPEQIAAPRPTREMIDSVRHFGVLKPVILTEGPEGLAIEDGRGRVLAARAAELESIPAHIYPSGIYTPGVITLMLNRQRRANPAAELDIVEALLKEEGISERLIAAATGKGVGEIRALLKLQRLTPALRAALEAGALSGTSALRASRLTPEQQGRLEVILAEHGKLKQTDVDGVRRTAREAAAAGLPWEALLLGAEADNLPALGQQSALQSARALCDRLPEATPKSLRRHLAALVTWLEQEA